MQGNQGRNVPARAPAEDEVELDEKLVMGDADDNTDEINTVIPTGFCSEEEVELMREQQRLLGTVRYIEERVNKELADGEGIKLKDVKNDIIQSMNFIAHSSKSLGGSAFKATKTQRVLQREDLFQRQEDDTSEESVFSKIKEMAKGRGNQENKPILPEPEEQRGDQW
ncbi:MAG: hypothetical protein SVS85_04275 [Candidatus Nanohaloarchaea archaeon]|nr:hypothetical protein [Candidatus Nanohaloarchaea archaeon]